MDDDPLDVLKSFAVTHRFIVNGEVYLANGESVAFIYQEGDPESKIIKVVHFNTKKVEGVASEQADG